MKRSPALPLFLSFSLMLAWFLFEDQLLAEIDESSVALNFEIEKRSP
jgi:hypothetical protein